MDEVIDLPRRLDAATVPGLSTRLADALAQGDLHLNASATTHIGALGAQMLLSAQSGARAADKDLLITNLGDRARHQLSIMGLTELSLPEIDQ